MNVPILWELFYQSVFYAFSYANVSVTSSLSWSTCSSEAQIIPSKDPFHGRTKRWSTTVLCVKLKQKITVFEWSATMVTNHCRRLIYIYVSWESDKRSVRPSSMSFYLRGLTIRPAKQNRLATGLGVFQYEKQIRIVTMKNKTVSVFQERLVYCYIIDINPVAYCCYAK